MHPEQIKAAMRMAGKTSAVLAEELKVTGGTVSQVINGRAESARIKRRIAEIIGKPVSVIWPDDGRPRLQRPKGSVPARKRARA